MENGWPNEHLFIETVKGLLNKAKQNNRKIRVFGEMVALLWAEGHNGATVQLEHLGNEFCSREAFCLFCAYPKSGFTQNANESIRHICNTHSKIVDGEKSSLELVYRRA